MTKSNKTTDARAALWGDPKAMKARIIELEREVACHKETAKSFMRNATNTYRQLLIADAAADVVLAGEKYEFGDLPEQRDKLTFGMFGIGESVS